MSKKQWIWLLIAVAVFVAAGVISVAMNTWRSNSLADMYGSMSSLYGGIASAERELALPEEPFLAKIDIEGTIVDGDGVTALASSGFDLDYILDYIDRLTDCEANQGIVLFVNSGGGEIKASDEVYLKLMDYKRATGRPVYAYFDGTACSGAYYIAMAADSIWANRNCVCVNIGVYIETYNLSGLFEKYGVEEIMIRSSENKGIGAIGQEWTEEQLAIYQSIVDLYYDQFLEVVADGRGMTKDQVRTLDDGREMLAAQALQAGFIDGICRWSEYEDYLVNTAGMTLYEEEPGTEMFSLLQYFYGKLAALSPRSEIEIVRDFMDKNDGIVVMAYAG